MPSSLMAVVLFSVVPLVAATGSAIPTTTTDSTARSLEDLNSNLKSNLHWQHRRGNSELVPVDQSLLAAQVGGLVAAYVVFVAILLSLLFFVGRRLRRTVHSSNYSLQVEMMKPIHPPPLSSVEPSPISPVSAHLPGVDRGNGFGRSLTNLTRGPKSHRMSSNGSAGGSAASIDESVVASDRRRAQEQMELLYAAVMEQDEQKEAGVLGMDHDNSSSSGSGSGSHHQHYNSVQSPHSSTISNPFTDRSSRVLDEPFERPQQEPEPPPQPQQQPPTSPRSTNSRLSKRISSLSLFNSNHRTSNTGPSTTSKILSPRLPKKLSISSPLASPDVTASSSYGDEQPPLTPRLYNPTAPPAPPIRVSPAPPPPAKSSGMGRAPAPAPLSLSSSSHLASSSSNGPSQGGSLPFRDAFPPQSAPATKTTILERPTKQLNGPRTGMPTPYSPYMPFTPVTPLTPSRMVTRRERKRGGRENGLRVLNEDEDLVKDDKDMWGY